MTERIQFTCSTCGKDVDREPGIIDVEGLTPSRCVSCVLNRLSD